MSAVARSGREIADDDQPMIECPLLGDSPFEISKENATLACLEALDFDGRDGLLSNAEIVAAGLRSNINQLDRANAADRFGMSEEELLREPASVQPLGDVGDRRGLACERRRPRAFPPLCRAAAVE